MLVIPISGICYTPEWAWASKELRMFDRRSDLIRFYQSLGRLEEKLGGWRILAECDGRMNWPRRGVYFFFENGERRVDTGTGDRIVRVGTHALKQDSKTTLWNRLSQHRGVKRSGSGNHRGSVFRSHLGTALLERDSTLNCRSWGNGSSAPAEVRRKEQHLEILVSEIVRAMPFLWLGIDDPSGPGSDRGYIERNAIALLSNFNRLALDPPTDAWLGQHSASERVRNSGLWNSNHVDEMYDNDFLNRFDQLVSESGG